MNFRIKPDTKINNPGTALFSDAPSEFIELSKVDYSVGEHGVGDGDPASSSVILFDWKEFINTTIAHEDNPVIKEKFLKGISSVLKKLGYKNIKNDIVSMNSDVEKFLNKEINKSLTSFHANINASMGGSSASISLENIDDKWIIEEKGIFYKQPLIQEGIRFVIDAQERFNPNYFCRVFSGFITRAETISNPVTRTLNLTATDYSRYFTRSRYNIHPAAKETDKVYKQAKIVPHSTSLHGKSGREIVKILSKGESSSEAISLGILEKTQWEDIVINTDKSEIIIPEHNRNWQYRYEKSSVDFSFGDYVPKLIIWGDSGQVYQSMIATFALFVSERQTKKDILYNVAETTFFSLYLDGAGNLHFHPPRFEYKNYLQVTHGLKESDDKEPELLYQAIDDELIAQTYGQGEGSIVTVQYGNYEQNYFSQGTLPSIHPDLTRRIVVWKDGVNRHGILENKFTTAAIQYKNAETYLPLATAAKLVRTNLERFTMNISMPLRSEIQVDRPIYDTNTEKVYYIKGVTHTYNAGTPTSGGTWQTDVICSMGRNPEFEPVSNVFSDSIAEEYDNVKKMGGDMFNLELMKIET